MSADKKLYKGIHRGGSGLRKAMQRGTGRFRHGEPQDHGPGHDRAFMQKMGQQKEYGRVPRRRKVVRNRRRHRSGKNRRFTYYGVPDKTFLDEKLREMVKNKSSGTFSPIFSVGPADQNSSASRFNNS